ncbi:MAG: leucine--tRNA ligase [Flavobacteriales bacterium]
MEYDFRAIEQKWQKEWRSRNTYAVREDHNRTKYYVLDMFPYPSGAGLHVGHPLGYIASDIIARYRRHQGFNVLHPMGYDSFGLPAEQYAIQTGQHPEKTTVQNIARYREQLDKIGFSFDWSREVRTSDPQYYRWTQWIFSLIYNSWYNTDTNRAEPIHTLIAHFEDNGNYNVNAAVDEEWHRRMDRTGFVFSADWDGTFSATDWNSMSEELQQRILMQYRLTYLADSMVNWCPALGTVLANDEVKDGVSERGGHPVEQKLMRQWSMRISAYAERLLSGLETIDWPENIKEIQRNWIGRSEGARVQFAIDGHPGFIDVFTTRPDTIFGVSFMTLAPEHELVMQITTPEYGDAVEKYIAAAKLKTERDRQADVKHVTGQFTGAYAIHPFTGNKVPVWIGEYVLAGYGTGAVMAVPAGDQRDYDFAKKFDLAIPPIFEGADLSERAETSKDAVLTNSDFLNGLSGKQAMKKVIAEIESRGIGEGKVNYRMRDAVFSRQRYWGEPIPVYFEDEVPRLVPDDELPVTLPPVDKYLPTEDGEPPLARAVGWEYAPGMRSINSGTENLTPDPSPKERGETDAGLSGEKAADSEAGFSWQTVSEGQYSKLRGIQIEQRSNPTPAEEKFWELVRDRKVEGVKFRRHHIVGPFIPDFVCLELKLIVEIDGLVHLTSEVRVRDDQRQAFLEHELHFEVIRFSNDAVLERQDHVLSVLKNTIQRLKARQSEGTVDSVNNISDRSPLSLGVGPGVRLNEESGGRLYRREYNTMPGWAGSSWYFLRYMDPNNPGEFASRDKVEYWGQVDLYMGGAEHATGHLLYSRFWTKVLFDLGYIGFDEPFKKMINQGMITGVSEKIYMNKIRSNVFLGWDETGAVQVNFGETKVIYISSEIYERMSVSEQSAYTPVNVPISLVDRSNVDVWALSRVESFKDAAFVLSNGNILLDGRLWTGKLNGWAQPTDGMLFRSFSEIEKMSKSKFNVQTPDELVEKFGADTLRCYEMFLGPVEQSKPWDTKGINGVYNFLRKFWRLFHDKSNAFAVSDDAPTKEELKTLHKTIKKVTEDLNRYSWNTVVSTMMIGVNELTELQCNKRAVLEPMCVLLSPYAPHMAEELWEKLGHSASITEVPWPAFDEAYLTESSFDYPVSFNGKTRFFVSLPVDWSQEQVTAAVMEHEGTAKYLEGKAPKKVIVVPKRIVNVVM